MWRKLKSEQQIGKVVDRRAVASFAKILVRQLTLLMNCKYLSAFVINALGISLVWVWNFSAGEGDSRCPLLVRSEVLPAYTVTKCCLLCERYFSWVVGCLYISPALLVDILGHLILFAKLYS